MSTSNGYSITNSHPWKQTYKQHYLNSPITIKEKEVGAITSNESKVEGYTQRSWEGRKGKET